MYYSGIGSRDTPDNVLLDMERLAFDLAQRGWTLRSGGAKGADSAFQKGAEKYGFFSGKSLNNFQEIYLPWKNFGGNQVNPDIGIYCIDDVRAAEIASKYHPVYKDLTSTAKLLMNRNSHQVLGKDLNTLSNMLICWTKTGGITGGTGQAMRIAEDHNIPIFNLANQKDYDRMRSYVDLQSLIE